jgi:hypothetical protein
MSFKHALSALFISLLVSFAGCGKSPLSSHHNQTLLSSSSPVENKSIIGQLDWYAVGNLSSKHPYVQLARSVGLIEIPAQQSRCTAFLISDDLIMTNWHCFPNESFSVGARFFPYFLKGSHRLSYQTTSSFSCSELLITDEERDVAILRCSGSPGKKLGSLALLQHSKAEDSEQVMVIQQNCDYFSLPQCAPIKRLALGKMVSAQSPLVQSFTQQQQQETGEADFYYTADTLGGSSGSPVFSPQSLAVKALHHRGMGQTPWSQGRGVVNSGVSMNKILDFLHQDYPKIYEQLRILD